MKDAATDRAGRREVAARLVVVLLLLVVVVTAAVDMGRAEPGTDGWSMGCPLHANPGFIALPAVPVIMAVARMPAPVESSESPGHLGPAIFVPPRG
jgi:hypothetical protein